MADVAAANIATVAPGMQNSMAGALSANRSGLSVAREMLAAKRAEGQTLDASGKPLDPQKTKGDPSEAARILQQRATQARQERQAEAARQQEAAGAAGSGATNTANDATGDLETDDQLQPDAQTGDQTGENAQSEEDPDQAAIDLGEGVSMTRAEVKQHLLRQADYTQKTQALSAKERAFEADRTGRLQVLDTLIGNFTSQIGQPKSLRGWLAEDPVDGLARFAEQQERMDQLNAARHVRAQEQAHHISRLRESTVNALKGTHGDKAQGYFDQAIEYVAPLIGYDRDTTAGLLAHPEAVQIVHDAKAWRNLQGTKGNVQRTIAGLPKVVKPGAKISAQAGVQSKFQNAVASLKASGTRADAVQALQARRALQGG